jgi:hypothetical protein
MITKKQQCTPVDLTDKSDDEIFYIAECFTKEFKKLLESYKPYFGHHDYFEKLYRIYYSVKDQLKKEERMG